MAVRTSFGKTVKVKPKEYTYGEFVKDFQLKMPNTGYGVIGKLLSKLTPTERAKCIVTYIDKTPISSYKTILSNFKRVLNRYYNDGDKKNLKIVQENIIEAAENTTTDTLAVVRSLILLDLINDDYDKSVHAVEDIINHLLYLDDKNIDYDLEYQELYKDFLMHAAPYVWPEAKNLEILYGK